MTLKFFSESYASSADATVMELSYLATARSVASINFDAGVQAFVLDTASTSPAVVVVKYTASTTSTTAKPAAARARRSLTAVGDLESLGGFSDPSSTTGTSWCEALAATAKSAIFCESTTDNTMTLSYLDMDLANADTKSLTALTGYTVKHDSDPATTLIATVTVNKDMAADALCDKFRDEINDVASCSHGAVTIPSDDGDATRRRLSTADVTVTLGFLSQAAFDAAVVAAEALRADPSALKSAGVTDMPSVTDGSGSPLGTRAPSPGSEDPEDPADPEDPTSTAALRVVSLLGLVGFVLA